MREFVTNNGECTNPNHHIAAMCSAPHSRTRWQGLAQQYSIRSSSTPHRLLEKQAAFQI